MARKIDSVAEIADVITKATLISGTISIGLVAPTTAQVTVPLVNRYLRHRDKRALLRKSLRYMKHRRYITVAEQPDGSLDVAITEKGKRRYQKRQFDSLAIEQPRSWDKKWRIVIFDIPESHKAARNALNLKLKQLGFYQLQRSTWAHPFPCRDEIDLIKEVYEITPFVSYLETDNIDSHNHLVKQFQSLLQS